MVTRVSAETLSAFLLRTKLYWSLLILLAVGIFTSPVSSKGVNIFLSTGNLSDVLRQVSNNGIVAVGMTLVILTGGIDLSVGSIMALGSVLCAMLLTYDERTSATLLSFPILALVCASFAAWGATQLMGLRNRIVGTNTDPPHRIFAGLIGLGAAIVAWWLAASQVPTKFGVLGILVVVPAVGLAFGWLNGLIITKGRLQPFIVTLAMMVGVLGIARIVAGQDAAVHPVYTGTNATEDFDILRALLYRVVPVPGLFFLAVVLLSALLLRATTFGRYVYAIGGNEQAARLSGVAVDQVKIAVYAISGFLASLAGVLYTAQYRQGKPDAGVGMELDAIAAVVIGGTSLMGGKGSIAGTFVGVLIFGFLGNILQLNNIDSNTQLVLKGGIILAAVLVQERSLSELFSLRKLFVGTVPRSDAVQPGSSSIPHAEVTATAAEARLADHQ
ncbi:ABC transporter permease [Microvirga sp. TS319]|uniref:ABC transporter permease n=1 Tax=Microvirga sp. TS319 TaxID=3241165 RepID=UPI00351A3B37